MLVKPPVHSRHHYDNEDDNVMIGEKRSVSIHISPSYQRRKRTLLSFCLATGWYFADKMKCENLRFEKEGETRAGEGIEMEAREKELGKIGPESAL